MNKPARSRPSVLPDDLDLESLKATPGKAVPQPSFHERPAQVAEVIHQIAPAPVQHQPAPVAQPVPTPMAAPSPSTQTAPAPIPYAAAPQPAAPVVQAAVSSPDRAGEGGLRAVDASEAPRQAGQGDIKARAVNLTVYLLPGDHKRLRRLAVDRDTSIQSLVMDGIDRVFQESGLDPVERWDPKRRVRT